MTAQNHSNGNSKGQMTETTQNQAVVLTNGLEPNGAVGLDRDETTIANVPKVVSHQIFSDDEVTSKNDLEPQRRQPWQRLSLRSKATFLAIAIGTIPLLGIGTIAYFSAKRSLTQQISQVKISAAKSLADKANRFIFDYYSQVNDLASIPSLTNPKLENIVSVAEKEDIFNRVVSNSKVFDSIALIDLNGKVILQSTVGKNPSTLSDYKGLDFFDTVIKTDRPLVSRPQLSTAGLKLFSVFIVTPVKNSVTKKNIAVLRARIPMSNVNETLMSSESAGDNYRIVSADGKIILDSTNKSLNQSVAEVFPNFSQLQKAGKPNAEVGMEKVNNTENLIAYAPTQSIEGFPDLNWSAIINTSTASAFEPERNLLLAIALGSAVTALFVSTIATHLARKATQPILDAADAVEKLGQGNLGTRINIEGEDEVAMLGSNINQMASQIQTLLGQQEEAAREKLLAQTEIARQQTEFALQQSQRNEAIQQELLRLLSGVEAASEGDLTVRAEISAGEIGIVADFFNSIIESLRDVVTQVKQSTEAVNASLGEDESAMRQLADDSLNQAKEIERLLGAVEIMSRSIQDVAANANQAAQVARQASATARSGGVAMDDTVQSILYLRETVAETAKKVKRLGESSQQISKVISLINQIALQTNLLAINASIEAARAGEEGRGFAVVAEEVGALAARSATATKEIEQIVEKIQLETNEVVFAMETGTAQVVEGTNLVANAKKSLEQIMDVSNQIDQLVQSISLATVSQASTSESVTTSMKEIASVSERTSEFSRQISSSLQQTVAVARQLQGSVDTFKVEAAT